MKQLPLLSLILLFLSSSSSFAQLPFGATAPDWTHTDINGNTHHLYSLLDQGKMVVLKFSATWCAPCWNYMQSGALETFWDEHGPNGTNEAQVFYIESDQNTGMSDLLGQTGASQGNWVAAIPFPIIDLQVGENTDNEYLITYYPTLYAICSDRKIYELGQVPASEWSEFIQSCALDGSVVDLQPAACFGEGSATVEATGGVSPITYEWNTGHTGPTIENVGIGEYSVTITEANGREVILDEIIITGPSAPVSMPQSTITSVSCHGTPTGGVSVQMAGGTPPYAYQWSNGAQTQNIINVPAGPYDLVVLDHNSCPFETSFAVPQPDEVEADAFVTPDYCDLANGTIELDIFGGTGAYTVTTSAGTLFGHIIVDLQAGMVNIGVEDANGCTWSNTIVVTSEDAPDLTFTPDPVISCSESQILVEALVEGGSDAYLYFWSTPDGNIIGPINESSILVDHEGTFNLIVIDLITGCQIDGSVIVSSMFDLPEVSAGDDIAISCDSPQILLQGSGNAEFFVSWSTSNGIIVSGGDTYTPVIAAAGTYTITIINPLSGCANQDEVEVMDELDPAQAGFQFQSNGLMLTCTDISAGENITEWLWSFGDGNTSTDQHSFHTYAEPGIYEVCLTVLNGCGANEICHQVEISGTTSLIQVIANIQHVLCHGDHTGGIELTVSGGSGNYTYSWTGPDGTMYSTPSLEESNAGQYQLVISDDAGNLFTGIFTIHEPPALVMSGSEVVHIQCHGEATGSLRIEIEGGSGPYTYSFNGNPFITSNTINELSAGSITGTVIDANGCLLHLGEFVILEPDELTVQVIEVMNTSGPAHDNGRIEIAIAGGTAPYMVSWNHGATGTIVSGLLPGAYLYTIVDAHGCEIQSVSPIIIEQSVSLPDVDLRELISISPNPSFGNVRITWKESIGQQNIMTLFSVDGRPIDNRVMSRESGFWDLAGISLSSGVYFLSVKMDERIVTFKIVIV